MSALCFKLSFQESSHNTHFLLMHPLSKVEFFLFFFSLLNSVKKSITSTADAFDLRFLFFFETAFAKGDSSSSPVEAEAALAVANEETVAGGIIFGSFPKKSVSSSSHSHSLLLFPV